MARELYKKLSDVEGGGDLCLAAIKTFRLHTCMQTVPIPSNLTTGISNSAYGLLHYTGDVGDNIIGYKMKGRSPLAKLIARGDLP